MEVIAFYDRLSNLERVKAKLSSITIDLATSDAQTASLGTTKARHYASALDEIIKRITQLLPDAENLIAKLPQ